jgi:hypothetical protein
MVAEIAMKQASARDWATTEFVEADAVVVLPASAPVLASVPVEAAFVEADAGTATFASTSFAPPPAGPDVAAELV